MIQRNWIAVALLAALTGASNAQAGVMAKITPSELKLTVTRFSLILVNESKREIFHEDKLITLKASDDDFAKIKLGSPIVPEGRYAGVSVCYQRSRRVKLLGDTATVAAPTAGADLATGSYLCTNGTSPADVTKVVNAAACTDATEIEVGVYAQDVNTAKVKEETCTDSFFGKTVCIAENVANCEASDEKLEAGITMPDVNLLADMYNMIEVHEDMTLTRGVGLYPVATIGDPGAALHIGNHTADAISDITLLFDSNRQLLWSSGNQLGYGGNAYEGFCSGQAYVELKSGGSPVQVAKYDKVTGLIQYAAGHCLSMHHTGTCEADGRGVMTFNILGKALNDDFTVSCVADSAAQPPYLGASYVGGNGQTGTATLKILKIVDPKDVMQISGTLGCPGAGTGVCGAYPGM